MRGFPFQTSEGQELTIHFQHTRGGKGKPPKSTICRIMRDDFVVRAGVAKPLTEVAVAFNGEDAMKRAVAAHGKPGTKFYKLGNTVIAVIRGDRFSYERGRKESLKKALADMDRTSRRNAWNAVLPKYAKKKAD